jgi:hypothetical protein
MTIAHSHPSETTGRALAIIDRRCRHERRQAFDRRGERPSSAVADLAARPDAGFVAHLIATSVHAPQTRNLRRADADVAAMAYRGVASPKPVETRSSFATRTA